MQEQIIDIQMQLTFHDDSIDALNVIVMNQSNEIDALKQELVQLKEQMRALLSIQTDKVDDAPPPHY